MRWHDEKMQVYQGFHVFTKRNNYFIKLQQYKSQEYKIFYEVRKWGNANHVNEYMWQLEKKKTITCCVGPNLYDGSYH